MSGKVINFLEWTLSSKVNPLFYLVTSFSLSAGLFFTFFTQLPDIQNTLLYKYGVFGGITWWGVALLIASILIMYGLKFRKCNLVKIGAMVNTMAWLFAAITYVQHDFFYAFVTFGIIFTLINGYIYLAASLNYLWTRIYVYSES